MAGPGAGKRATLTALGANACIAVAKFVAFFFTGSASMLAESIHSVADTSNQALLLVGMRRARRAATPAHPFGYGRERYFWAFVVAIILFTLGSLFSLFEGVEKMRHPHELGSFGWAVGVLVIAFVFETYALSVAVREANTQRTGSWWSFVRHSKSPEIPVVLLEDAGALLGIVFALVGVGLAAGTGDARFDAMGSIGIGVLLGFIAVILAAEMKSLLIGEAASASDLAEIERAIVSEEHLEELIHFRTQHIGPDELLVAAKVRLKDDIEVVGVVEAINRIEKQVRERVPAAKTIYIEPDVAGAKLWSEP